MQDSVFTKIIKCELPAEIIYEDDYHIVIISIEPHNPGHSLVIPKNPHNGEYWQMSEEEFGLLNVLTKKISQAILTEIKCPRVGLVIEGWGIPNHVHINLIPIYKPGDLDHDMAKPIGKKELAKMGERLRSALKKAGL